MADSQPAPLILCMENATGEEVALQIEPNDDFQVFLEKAKELLGFDVDINSITRNEPVALTDNAYQFLLNAEQSLATEETQNLEQVLEPNDGSNDLVYILDDGTQIRASQIHFDNEDQPLDLTAEKLPFVKYADDGIDYVDQENLAADSINYNIIESPISRWSSKNSSPKCSFVNSLPFKLVCNNTSGFEAQFTKYLEASTAKTYATLNPVTNRNKSPRSLIKDNYKNYDELHRNDFTNMTREEVLNMFKDSPVASLPYENCQNYAEKRRHVRKTDPSRLVHKNWNAKPSYENMILGAENQNCFICGKYVNDSLEKMYLFDNEDQRLHRSSPQKKLSTQLKIICEQCLDEYFKPSRMKSPNQSLNPEEYLVIRNNQQYIFQKTKNINFKTNLEEKSEHKKESNIYRENNNIEFLKVEIGSDGEIITKPIGKDLSSSDDVVLVKDGSSDVEIIEPEIDDHVIDNLEDADEDVKEFLGKYQCGVTELKELKCRFCCGVFDNLDEVIGHGEEHKHDIEDGLVFPCPLCDYGYSNFKWLKGHLKAAHNETVKEKLCKGEDVKIENEEVKSVSTETSPIAKRTRSSIKKIDIKNGEKNENPEDTKNESTNAESEMEKMEITIKTEVKQEWLGSDDEIWIVQTEDAETESLPRILNAVKGSEKAEDSGYKKTHRCVHCSHYFASAESLASHKCRRRGRKRKTEKDEAIIIPTQEDFIKRAQGRPRFCSGPVDNDLLVVRPRRKKSREPTSDPHIVTCHNCNESFTSKVRLKFHMQFHDNTNLLTDGQYVCDQCDDTTFKTETELFDHVHFQHHKQKRWQCPVKDCGKTFYLRATLTKHSRIHTDTRRYVCVVCNKRFLDKQTLDEHGVTHLQIKPFQCHICLKQLTRRSRLRMHLRAHEEELTPKLVLVCAVCSRAFRDHQDAQEHATKSTECIEVFANELKEETEERVTMQLSPTSGIVRHSVQVVESPKLSKPIKRQVDNSQAESLLTPISDEARNILRVVEIEKAFRCEYCEDVFYLEDGLNTHRAIHKGVKNPFTCHICKVSFATYSRCTTHKTTHGFYKRSLADAKKEAEKATSGVKREAGPSATGILGYGGFPVVKHFLCEDCGRSYLHWTYLQVHRRMKHANENFLYKCNHCDLTFPNSWSVAYHKKKFHTKSTDDNPTQPRIVRPDYRIPCRDCDEVLPNKTALYKHRKKEHSRDAEDDAYRGDDERYDGANSDMHRENWSCNKWCSREDVTHARPHTCQYCGLTFRTMSMRNEHMRIHTGERPFPCDVCGVAFKRSTAMRNHRLIHTGVRAWACGRCPKRFRIRSDLRTHLRLKHPAQLTVIEVAGIHTSTEEVMEYLTINNIPHDKVVEITAMSFVKGTTSIIPNTARALAMLSDVPRVNLTFKEQSHDIQGDMITPVRRGRGIDKNPRRPKILQRGEDPLPNYPLINPAEELSDLNDVQRLLRDGVLVNGNQMVQLQLDDTMLLE